MGGDMRFISGIKIAHLALKHRQGKNHKTRIVAFVGSPIEADEKEMIKLAKKLKKEKVNIDIVNFGEDESNTDMLNKFVTTINGKEGTGSHLVTIPPGTHLSDALVSSPIVQGEDGSGAGSTRLSTVSRGCSPTLAWTPSREPSTTCPSPLHFTGSPICRLDQGRNTNLLPDPGYVALTNICLEDGE